MPCQSCGAETRNAYERAVVWNGPRQLVLCLGCWAHQYKIDLEQWWKHPDPDGMWDAYLYAQTAQAHSEDAYAARWN